MSAVLPLIDAHQHFWDLRNDLPWLRERPRIPFRYGDYGAICRDYMPDDYRQDTAGFDIAGSVYVEAEWNRSDPVAETRWVHELAAAQGLPSAVVCHAALDRADVAEVLAQQASFPLVRSLRHKPAPSTSPAEVREGRPGSMTDPAWQRGYALLARHGLSFDLQTPWWHLREAAALNRRFPETTIVLNHTGLPADRTPSGIAGWEAAMAELAACPNVAVKISGLGQPDEPWTVEANAPLILRTIELFGEDRCMFASNFPVDSLVASFDTIYGGFFAATASMSAGTIEKLFAGNARRFYRISEARA